MIATEARVSDMANNKKNNTKRTTDTTMSYIGPKLKFEGREAYNLLRTNLMFAIKRNDRNARVIGVTSSIHGEGKSLTAINMAYSIAESGQKVVLVFLHSVRRSTFPRQQVFQISLQESTARMLHSTRMYLSRILT